MADMNTENPTPDTWRWLKAIGPGLIIACVVIGPGSILTSSKVGAADGYAKAWVVVAAVFFMLAYMTLGAKLGVVSQQSAGDLVSRHAGRWLAIVIGAGVFFISAAFQFGNNLGVHAALSTYAEFDYWVIVFNAISIAFVFGFRNLYRVVERLMACFVALMLLSFAANLIFARPNLLQFLAGMIPFSGSSDLGLPLLGLVGTTFVITAAYYQSYLVRFKGWKEPNLRSGLIDARVGAILMALITLMIMTTAASALRGKQLNDVTDVAEALKPLFQGNGQWIFCLGLFAAAFSSFIVNSMIGGFILSDALKLGSSPQERWPRVLTVAVLLVGMGVALYVIKTRILMGPVHVVTQSIGAQATASSAGPMGPIGQMIVASNVSQEKAFELRVRPVAAIVAAQAVTVIAAPLMAGALLWLTNLKSVMGKHRNGVLMNIAAGLGFVVLLLLAAYLSIYKVWPEVRGVIGF